MSKKLQTLLKEVQQALAALYGERLVMLVLFGSQARGDAQPDSDIDLLVVLKGLVDSYCEIERTGDVVTQLSLKFNEVLTCVFVSEDDYQTQDLPLFRNIRHEGIPL